MGGRVITIDGPGGAGKSTVARRLADRLGFLYLDTGALYRAVAFETVAAGLDETDGRAVASAIPAMAIRFERRPEGPRVATRSGDLSEAIRTDAIARAASRVSALPEVRAALLEVQREVARDGDVVVEGRDTGTVVFPDAAVKVYLDADPAERARRRQAESAAAGRPAALDEVRASIEARDRADAGRSVAPLRVPPGALVIDTTGLSIDEVVGRIAAALPDEGAAR